MSEDSSQSLGLGEHVDRAISEHITKHAGEVATEKEAREAGKAERMQKGQALYDALERAVKAEPKHSRSDGNDSGPGNWNTKEGLSPRTIQERPDGTTIRAGLDPGDEYTDRAVRRSTMSNRYLNDGPAVDTYDGRPFSLPSLPNGRDPAYTHELLAGLNLNLSISNHDTETGIRNNSQVFVARIIDPESLLVPEAPAEDGTPLYSLIGAQDPRFAPIMETVSRIASQPRELPV